MNVALVPYEELNLQLQMECGVVPTTFAIICAANYAAEREGATLHYTASPVHKDPQP